MSLPTYIHIEQPVLLEKYSAFLLDIYGVFWGGHGVGLFPGCRETMKRLTALGKTVGILSNASQPEQVWLTKLQSHGIHQGEHFHFLVTSGEQARRVFIEEHLPFPTPQKKYFLFCTALPFYTAPQTLFEGSLYTETTDIQEADFIYIPVPHLNEEEQTDPKVFREMIYQLVRSNKPMVCANPDHHAHEGSPPRAVVRQGSIAALYEEAGGFVFYVGKPHPYVYQHAMDQFIQKGHLHPQEVLMVGDTPETDIRGARAFGMATALITKTGIMSDRIAQNGEKELFNLPPHDQPDLFLERFSSV